MTTQNVQKTKDESIGGNQFKPITSQDLVEILGLTIKKDNENKIITFLGLLSAYTEDSQFNLSFNAPSSTGKSYIPTEIAQFFPEEDVLEIGYCSSTAFFHDVGNFDKKKNGYIVDLSRKIVIFLDQPHAGLLGRLRPILSHDKKEIQMKITDKSQKGGLRTKNVFLKGFPVVIFCSAGLNIDEQEGTRFFLLSPDTGQEKIREAIWTKIKKESDKANYTSWLESEPSRIYLRDRVRTIKAEGVKDVKIPNPEQLGEFFLEGKHMLKPRHQRDIGRLLSLIKAFALLNVFFREREGDIILASEEDIKAAVEIWGKISDSQEHNLSPYVFNLFREIIMPAFEDKNRNAVGVTIGVGRQDILNKHMAAYGRALPDWQLRQQIVPMLECSGLIYQESDPNDKRQKLIYPTSSLTTSVDDETIVSELGW